MKRLAVIGWLLLGAGTAHATYSGYTYQRILTIDHTKVSTMSATYTNMPVLVSTIGVTFSTAAAGGHLSNANGYDLIFSTMNDCSFKLSWDTEAVNATGVSSMTVWVNVPSISSTTDTVFYVCYGNSGISTYQSVSSTTWDANFKGVWHFTNGLTLATNDSTSVGNTWTNTNTVLAATGQVDGGLVTNGSNNLSLPANTVSLQIADNITMESWFKGTGTTQKQSVFNNQNQAGTNTGISYGVVTVVFQQWEADGTTLTGIKTVSDSVWHHIATTFVAGVGSIYVDGLLDKTGTFAGTTVPYGTTQPEYIGRNFAGTFDAFTGDEYRISNVARSPGWIQTEYKNQSAPTTFMTIGAETTSAAATNNAIFFGSEM